MARHQCIIYDGAPSKILPQIAAAAHQRLKSNYRCLYLNSPPMVAGIRCYLAADGIDVEREVAKGSLVLSSKQTHLVEGRFDIGSMLRTLEDHVERALLDGYDGLWATGDMTWEFGPEKNFAKLVEYESRLEELFQEHPSLCGICQYHTDTLGLEISQQGLQHHKAIFVNETLSRINADYLVGSR